MTILGKILVFLNLVFSLVTGALIVMVFVTRTNWKAGFDRLNDYYLVSEANVDTYRKEARDIEKQIRALEERLEREKDEHRRDVDEAKAKLDATERSLAQEQSKSKTAAALTGAITEETRRRQAEVENFQKQLAESEARRVEAEQRAKKSQDEAVAARIAATSEHERNRQLLETNEQLAKDLERERTRTGGTAGGVAQASVKPPPENVEGVVTDSDPRSGLVAISIGSDSGIQPNHTLEVFRIDGSRGQYVGMIRVVDSRFHEAVARVIPPLAPGAGQVRKGDRVATKLGGLSNRIR